MPDSFWGKIGLLLLSYYRRHHFTTLHVRLKSLRSSNLGWRAPPHLERFLYNDFHLKSIDPFPQPICISLLRPSWSIYWVVLLANSLFLGRCTRMCWGCWYSIVSESVARFHSDAVPVFLLKPHRSLMIFHDSSARGPGRGTNSSRIRWPSTAIDPRCYADDGDSLFAHGCLSVSIWPRFFLYRYPQNGARSRATRSVFPQLGVIYPRRVKATVIPKKRINADAFSNNRFLNNSSNGLKLH